MAKNIIKLNENTLKQIIREAIEESMVDEGQGWTDFKNRTEGMWNGDKDEEVYDTFHPSQQWDKEDFKRYMRNYINYGNETRDKDNIQRYGRDEVYDKETGRVWGRAPQNRNSKDFGKMNYGLGGKLGRAASVGATMAAAGVRNI